MKKSLLLLLWVIMVSRVFAQGSPPPFQKDVDAFVVQDRRQAPPANPVLLIGSSSFTFWKDVQQAFPGFPILNRGFGGSSLTDLIHFAPEIIFAYTPRQIIIYCGENDLAATPPAGPKLVLQRFRKLFNMIRNRWPEMPIVYISIKPSPSRWQLEPEFVEANRRISAFLHNKKNAIFLDVHTAMLDSRGETRPELYINDRLHMNAQGYAIWRNLLGPLLVTGEESR
jgi:lysophospholipase L1-like esterase